MPTVKSIYLVAGLFFNTNVLQISATCQETRGHVGQCTQSTITTTKMEPASCLTTEAAMEMKTVLIPSMSARVNVRSKANDLNILV